MWFFKVHPVVNIIFAIFVVIVGFALKNAMENDKINEDAFMSTAVEVNAWCTDVKERVSYAGRTRTTHYDAYFTYDYLDKSYNTCITDSGQLVIGEVYILYVDPANPSDCRAPYTEEYRSNIGKYTWIIIGLGGVYFIIGIIRWINRGGLSFGKKSKTTTSPRSYNPNAIDYGTSRTDPFMTSPSYQGGGFGSYQNDPYGTTTPYPNQPYGGTASYQSGSFGTTTPYPNQPYTGTAPYQNNNSGVTGGDTFGAQQTYSDNNFGIRTDESIGYQQPAPDNNFGIRTDESIGYQQPAPDNNFGIRTDESIGYQQPAYDSNFEIRRDEPLGYQQTYSGNSYDTSENNQFGQDYNGYQ